MKKSFHKLLAGAGAVVLLAGSPAMAIDLYGFASYWDKKDLDGEWGAGVGLSLPLFTEHLKLDAAQATLEKVTSEAFAAQREELKGDVLVKKGEMDAARAAYQSALDAGGAQTSPALQMKLDDLA